MKKFIHRTGVLCMALVITLNARAAFPNGEEEWISHAWQTDDGLPNNDVMAVAQDRDGSMYFATRGGLSRLDGLRLSDVNVGADKPPGYSVAGVYTAVDGSFWYVYDGVLYHKKDGQEERQYALEGLRSDARVVAMFEDLQGSLWLAFELGAIFKVSDGRLERQTSEPGLSASFASSVVMDSEGLVWGAGQRSLGMWRDGQFEKVQDIPAEKPAICAAKDGGLWVGIGSTLHFYTQGGGLVELSAIENSPPGSRVSAMLEDRHGGVWVGTFGNGLYLWWRNEFHKIHLPNHDVSWLMEDREGNMWVGTSGGGACRVRRRVLTMLDDPGAPVHQTARAFCEDLRGDVWVALQTGELFVRQKHQWRHLAAERDWPGRLATTVAAARNGDVWIATGDQTLVRWDGEAFSVHALPPKDDIKRIRAMMVARDGKLWFGRGNHVMHGLPGSWQSMQLTALQTEVQCLTTDARGAVWAGLQNGSLYVLHPEQESFEKKQFPELKNAGPVRAMVSAPDGALWLATARGGIARFKDGRMSRLDRSRGLNSNGISQLVLDSQGRLWGAGDRGIFAAPLSSLNAAADGRSTLATVSFYGRREGVPSIQANSGYQPNAMVMASARLWFASRSGIVVADPTQPGTNLVPPPVAIEGLRVNGQRIDLHKQSIQIGPGVNSLRFDLAAMSFVEPQAVSLWHRLSRVDDTWVAADATRVAAYGSLAPGNYQLRVRATNNDGIPSRKDAVLDFVVLPFFWQTLPFQLGLGGILFTGTAVAAYRFSQMKSRRQTEAFKREADIQRERTRIARDMHDQIGASLTQIALLAELAEYEQERGKASASADDLKLLANTSREAVSHLDEIVWAVNPRHDNLGSLLEYVGEKALQMTHAAGLRCRLNLPQDVPHVSLNADFRHHVFLMIQEALNNAVKHAEAQEISLQVTTHDENGIEIKIRDDGRGFDPDEKRTAESTHDGLQNLSDRAQSLKGICTIFSLPDAGSTITIQLPWPKS